MWRPRPDRGLQEYRRKIEELMTVDSEGRTFRMLVFRGSLKSSRKSIKMIDEMRRDDSLDFHVCTKHPRRFPKVSLSFSQMNVLLVNYDHTEAWILDAPRLKDDFYTNIMDWGKSNAVGDYHTNLAWFDNGKMVAGGNFSSKLQLWDAESSKFVLSLSLSQNVE
ncbi:hypothetical protein RJ641_033478 [Dillenia turbinata]|uniref:Uncharacterized protein n=1 Tax=Dillenia turbinata TaxID=194707 RepID=A0AAN8VYB1_9MAGN